MTRAFRRTLFACAAVALAACAPEAADTQGQEINSLYDTFTVAAAIVFVVTAGLIAFSIIRFRARPGDDRLPRQFHTNVPLEIVWFAIPTAIVIFLFVSSINTLGRVDEQAPEGASPAPLVVEVAAFQWGWRFQYEESSAVVSGDARTPPEVVLPVDRPIVFIVTGEDVVHSFYVPEFLMKRDAIPGRENRIDMTIEETGTYGGKCAEFCGLLHGDMTFSIRAVPESEFEAWLSAQEGE